VVCAKTFERAIPHASRDLRAVGRIESGFKRLVERQRVQDHGVVERADETIRLKTSASRDRAPAVTSLHVSKYGCATLGSNDAHKG